MKIALLQPGEMGAAVGRTLVAAGHEVRWSSVGRSAMTRDRAEAAGLVDRGDLAALLADSELILSICPPHAAGDVAAEVAGAGFAGTYLDGNAIAPSTATEVRARVTGAGAAFVDGGIIGAPPSDDTGPRLYLSGDAAPAVAALFGGTVVEAIVLDQGPFAASQIKMAYAAWSKGSQALLLTAMAAARRSGLDGPLTAEWARSQPGLADKLRGAEASDAKKGWRWIGEMEEIARSMEDLGLPDGFHRAAAAVYAADDIP
jgi:3-hydroxyisobutyrate dehydrogenase-like beta-hydroxyacid dehydrogenase